MNKLGNHPLVIAALSIILVGSVAVMLLRSIGVSAKASEQRAAHQVAQGRAADGRASAAAASASAASEVRDPFCHELLFVKPGERTRKPSATGKGQLPPLPLNISGLAPSSSGEIVGSPFEQQVGIRTLKLHGIVSGESPLAIIKETAGKTYFVRAGDHFGDGYTLTSVGAGEILVQHGGKDMTLRFEEGSEIHENTKG